MPNGKKELIGVTVGRLLLVWVGFEFGFIELFEGIKMPLTVNSPTACGRSPLGEGALGRG